jgi:hypothetical protein
MSKSAITTIFVGGALAFIAGLVLAVGGLIAALASGLVHIGGPSVVQIDGTVAWSMVGPVVIGLLAMAGGSLAGLIAWVGALVNTYQLEDKTWFVILLGLGLLSFGVLAMIAYAVAGPDSTKDDASQPAIGAGA